jgi:histidinol dehydrogenase
MLQRIDLRTGLGTLRDVLPRAVVDIGAASASVGPLIDDVRRRGAEAVLDASERFDGLRPASLRVPAEVIAAAMDALEPAVRAALTESIARARAGHTAQLPTESVTQIAPGGTVTQRWVPVRRVGLYVPGGLALYPSSVVMNVVPAQVAGVDAIAVTSPPQKEQGWPDPNVLAACALLGIDEVYAAGGAQGIALLALGDGTVIEPVDVITGPGNVYVTAAKRLLRGAVAIDSEAGPTEIAVIADESADPVHVAADLVSQAEHDPLAASVLITDSVVLADAVDTELAQRVSQTKHHERVRQALCGSGVVIVRRR